MKTCTYQDVLYQAAENAQKASEAVLAAGEASTDAEKALQAECLTQLKNASTHYTDASLQAKDAEKPLAQAAYMYVQHLRHLQRLGAWK